METYKKDQEYTLKVANTDNEVKEIKYTPDKDMSKPEMIMALKSKYKNFFKLIENKKLESYGDTRYEVSAYYDTNFKGLEDSLKTNDYSEVEDFIWEKLQRGNTVELIDTETGDRKRYSPETHDYEDETFEIDDYLIESKLIENDSTDIISTLNTLKDEFLNNLYKDKDKANEVKEQVKQVLQDAPDGTALYRLYKETSSGWTSHGSYYDERTIVHEYKKENGTWTMCGRKKDTIDDAMMSVLYNEGKFMTKEEAEAKRDEEKVNDMSSHRDIVNVGTDKWGNPVGKSTNRVDYPNKKAENVEIEKHREDKLNKLHSDIIYNFEEAYKDWGKEVSDTKAGFVNEYMSEYCNDYEDEINWKDYIVAIPELDKIYAEYKDVENWEIPDDIKWEQYELITDYVQNYLKDVYSKKEESLNNDISKDGSVIVLNYGRGTRFPDRQTAIDYYKECIEGTDPNGAENYAYQNILNMLVSTEEPVVYDWDDKTEYDWWIQKGKPTEDISDELLKAHLGENKIIEAENLSKKDITDLDEYTDTEIKKMYDKYCSENEDKKSFKEWQKENVDSALINELEYEFFSNRKKTEDLDIEDNNVGQTLNDVLTSIGDGHDIADNVYDVEVFFALIDEPDTSDNYDLYIQGLGNILKVVDAFDENDVNIIVNLTDYVIANKDVLLDLFEVNGETDDEIMEDLVCRVMPSVISGYTTDSVYKILLNTVKGGK